MKSRALLLLVPSPGWGPAVTTVIYLANQITANLQAPRRLEAPGRWRRLGWCSIKPLNIAMLTSVSRRLCTGPRTDVLFDISSDILSDTSSGIFFLAAAVRRCSPRSEAAR